MFIILGQSLLLLFYKIMLLLFNPSVYPLFASGVFNINFERFWLSDGWSWFSFFLSWEVQIIVIVFNEAPLSFKVATVRVVVMCHVKQLCCFTNWSIQGMLSLKSDKHHVCWGCSGELYQWKPHKHTACLYHTPPVFSFSCELILPLKHLPLIAGNYYCKQEVTYCKSPDQDG